MAERPLSQIAQRTARILDHDRRLVFDAEKRLTPSVSVIHSMEPSTHYDSAKARVKKSENYLNRHCVPSIDSEELPI